MRTVLFGLDGATYTVLDRLMSRGIMPNLKAFCESGSRAVLESTPHPITPQAWTTLATGRSAGHHGFTDFIRLEMTPKGPMIRFNTSNDYHCEPVWQYVSNTGGQATVLNYIGLAPPIPLNGHTMPGFVPGRHFKRASYPPDLFTKLDSVGNLDVHMLGLDFKIERQVLQEMEKEQWIEWIEHHLEREQAWFDIMEHLMIHEPSNLTAIVFDGVDKLQHFAYRYLDPALIPENPTEWESRVISLCDQYFGLVDKFLGRTVEIIGEEGRIVIASDHGFTATHEIFYINRWLHDEGYLHWKTEAEEDDKESIVVDSITRHTDHYDWDHTTAYALTPSSNGVYLWNVPEESYESVRDELIGKLLGIRAPDGGQLIIDVKKREEWFPGPYMHRAPDLTLTMRDHGFFSVLNARDALVTRREIAGTHHPDGIMIAKGTGIKQGQNLKTLNIIDVTPFLAHSLGLPIPSDYEGSFPGDFYEPAYLEADPPRVQEVVRDQDGRSPAASESPGSAQELEQEDQDALMERLRSLGYVE